MKHDCDIIRDLMPLVVDGTASDKSRALVDEHTAECGPCREMLEEMRQVVSAEAARQKDMQLVRKLRGHRRRRIAALILMGMMLVLLSLPGLIRPLREYWTYYYNDYSVLCEAETYDIRLVQPEDGGLIALLSPQDGRRQVLNSWYDGESNALYLWSSTTRRPGSGGIPAQAYPYGLDDEPMDEIERVYKGAPPEWFEGASAPELIYEKSER